jgi:hypothetical protein
VTLLGGAGQHKPVPTLLDGHEQVARARQRRHLLKERVDFLALFLPGLISYPALQVLTSDSRDHLVPAHADQPVQPPHRIGLAYRAQCPIPGERMLIVGIDERPVNIEDGNGRVCHRPPLPANPVPNHHPQRPGQRT